MNSELISNIIKQLGSKFSEKDVRTIERVLFKNLKNKEIRDMVKVQPQTNEEALACFISAKKVEGCSLKSILYYQTTIKKMLSVLNTIYFSITTEDIRLYLAKYQEENKISKATIDGVGNAEITATVKADKPGKFELGYAILADNQPGKGGSEPVYNDVVAAVSDNFIKMQEGVTLAADEEHTVTFNVSVPKFPGVAFKPADYKVVVFAHSDADGGMVDIANMCAFGSSVGYALN
jgi:hypothetical protein